MITINSVKDSVVGKLSEIFPDFEIYDDEIKQGMVVPCFFVQLINTQHIKELSNRYRRNNSYDIHFFAETGKNDEMYDVLEGLYEILEYIEVDGNDIRGTSMSHNVVDGVLHFFVQYNFMVEKVIEDAPLMQSIETKEYIK